MNRPAHGTGHAVNQIFRKTSRTAIFLTFAQVGKNFFRVGTVFLRNRGFCFCLGKVFAQVGNFCQKFFASLGVLQNFFCSNFFRRRVLQTFDFGFEFCHRFIATDFQLFESFDFRRRFFRRLNRRVEFVLFLRKILQGRFFFVEFRKQQFQFFASRFLCRAFFEFGFGVSKFGQNFFQNFLRVGQLP